MKATINRNGLSWLLLGWFWLCVGSAAWAQDSTDTDANLNDYRREARDRADPVAQAAPDDRSPRVVRYPAPARLDRYRQDRDYRYDRQPPPADDPIGRFINWLFDKIWDFLQSPAYRNGWRYVLLLGIAAFTGYLLWRADVLPLVLGRRAKERPLDYDVLTDDIRAIDFERAIGQAVDGRQYRLAVRLLYLQTLKQLTDSEWIDWQPDKTNRQYAHELTNTALRPGFEALTTRFEYVWYGDFPIGAVPFAELRAEFRQFNSQAVAHRPVRPVTRV